MCPKKEKLQKELLIDPNKTHGQQLCRPYSQLSKREKRKLPRKVNLTHCISLRRRRAQHKNCKTTREKFMIFDNDVNNHLFVFEDNSASRNTLFLFSLGKHCELISHKLWTKLHCDNFIWTPNPSRLKQSWCMPPMPFRPSRHISCRTWPQTLQAVNTTWIASHKFD